jgi:site-specific DNA-methyltransferase (adenine-specific)
MKITGYKKKSEYISEKGITSTVYLMDNMELMAQIDENYYSLSIVDPPYGIGEDGKKNHSRSKQAKAKEYTPKNWDNEPPTAEYFTELFRVSKNQIIWGANHFISRMPYDSACWLIWDKENGENDFADCEMAWASFGTAVRRFKFRWAGMLQGDMKNKENRIHPTQKPIKLYDWIFANYAKPTDTILDTHLGSGSSRIAAHRAGLHFVGCEIDEEYFDAAEKRFRNHTAQLSIF